MTDSDKQSKLSYIARCNAEELRGYAWGVKKIGREYFDGEREALLRRAKDLGVSL